MEEEKHELHVMSKTRLQEEHQQPGVAPNCFRGLPIPGPPFDVDVFEQVIHFKPDPTDIFVVTYPKCGTTWMQYIVWEIVNKGLPPPKPNEMIYGQNTFPYLEFIGVDNLFELQPPRLIKSHLPYQFVPHHPSAKYIYVMRNPWDCCVSYYHYRRKFPKPIELPFEKFINLFIQGKVAYGDFFDHVLSWYEHKNDPNVLFLTYEDMSADPKGAMLTTAKFLGDQYYSALKKHEEVLNNCLKYSDFKYVKDLGTFKLENVDFTEKYPDKSSMKRTRETWATLSKDSVDSGSSKEFDFFRKGIVGDWKNSFTEDEMRQFNDYIKEKISGTELEHAWTVQYGD